MPGRLKVKILAARDLPVMDRSSELTDAFVEVKFGSITFKTEVCRKTLKPTWTTDWFKFEVDDEDLQDEPLQIRVLDYDTYSSHNAIGKVYLDLNPLLAESAEQICGWFPIYDTLHGTRGEVKIHVKIDLLADFNRFKQSSCEVQFFYSPAIPRTHVLHHVLGFVEELAVNDDPEYKWIDKIRTPRASNEARQRVFVTLAGELQRKIGLRVLDMGGNAVLGYRQCFDLEGESGVVVRGIGTAVSVRLASPHRSPVSGSPPKHDASVAESAFRFPDPVIADPPAIRVPNKRERRLSESDVSGVSSGKGMSVTAASGSTPVPTSRRTKRTISGGSTSLEAMDYPFFTLTMFPRGFVRHLGGVVAARSVKLLDKIHNPDEPETRDVWWTELRNEVRCHARALGCNAVVGYYEHTTICEEIMVLSVMGTAATVSLPVEPAAEIIPPPSAPIFEGSPERHGSSWAAGEVDCVVCHIPYTEMSLPFPVTLVTCAVCRQGKVPDVLFTTVEIPASLPIAGKGCLVQARICRPKKDNKGETCAREISDILPFMEYELHNQLMNKVKIRGMNGLFGLQVQVTVGENMIVALGTGTAVCLAALPRPAVPSISSKAEMSEAQVTYLQDKMCDLVARNKEAYNLSSPPPEFDVLPASDDDATDADVFAGNKDPLVIELDDPDDAAAVTSLLEDPLPECFNTCNTEVVPGLFRLAHPMQLLTKVWRGELVERSSRELSSIVEKLIKSLLFKLRSLSPCSLVKMDFIAESPDESELLLTVTAMCLGHVTPPSSAEDCGVSLRSERPEENVFFMEGVGDGRSYVHPKGLPYSTLALKGAHGVGGSGVEVTPQLGVPGTAVQRYLGGLNFFFIRESTSLRELGGLSGFMQRFLAELLSIVRAHVRALGGNALVAYRLVQCQLLDNSHRNQAQCLVNVSGDAVLTSCEADDLLSAVHPCFRHPSHALLEPVSPSASSSPPVFPQIPESPLPTNPSLSSPHPVPSTHPGSGVSAASSESSSVSSVPAAIQVPSSLSNSPPLRCHPHSTPPHPHSTPPPYASPAPPPARNSSTSS